MEKLQPILKQKYWICFGLSLVFVLFGWWSASGDLAAKTAERKTSVEGSFSKAGQGATDPNESWVAGARKKTKKIRRRIKLPRYSFGSDNRQHDSGQNRFAAKWRRLLISLMCHPKRLASAGRLFIELRLKICSRLFSPLSTTVVKDWSWSMRIALRASHTIPGESISQRRMKSGRIRKISGC
jgi:hypothetical protein